MKTREKEWVPEPNSGCYIWLTMGSSGYGSVWDGSKYHLAHRYIYEREVGPIPKGMFIDHICRVRCCVNPRHLRVVTKKQNAIENSVGVSALNAKKTHCKYGHEFSKENTRLIGRRRACAICTKRAGREFAAKKRANNREAYNAYMREYGKFWRLVYEEKE